jgi:hypothetical protein
MRPVKGILLGSAAGIFAVASAQAQDLPVKAKPVEYVRVCSLYGAGFWYVPGTDTCIKIGAFAKLDVNFNADGNGAVAGGNQGSGNTAGGFGGAFDRATGRMAFRERAATSFDMRTQTEYGTLRSYVNVGQQLQTNLSGVGGVATLTPTGNASQFGTSTIFSDRAFVQFAGITAGKMRSFFDMVFIGAYTLSQARMTGDTSPNGIVGIAYTFQFGGGLSTSFSLEDGGWAAGGRGRSTVNLAGGGTPPAASDVTDAFGIGTMITDNKGQQFFDPVLNIRLDQAWGFVGASFAAHDASGGYYGTAANNAVTTTAPVGTNPACLAGSTTACGHPGDAWGWAGSLAFTVVNPFGLDGDSVGAQGVYAVGAVGYATAQWGASSIYGSGNNVGLSYLVDGVYNFGTGVDLTKTWSVNGYYEHVWNQKWRTSIYGGMLGIDFGDGKSLICPNGTATTSPVGFSGGAQAVFTGGVTNCNPNSSWTQLGSRTMWNPVPDLDIGFDVQWVHLNTAFAGSGNLNSFGTVFQPGATGRPAGTYTISNQDVLSGFFRIQRNFLY